MDYLPENECQIIEDVFTGNASVFEPRGNTEEAGKEPTILIVQDDESNRKISLSFLGPETICKRSMRSTNQPNIYIRFLEEHEEPLSDEIRIARLQDLSEVEILATHIPQALSTTCCDWTQVWARWD